MSAAAAPIADAVVAPAKGKKKLLIIIVALLLVVLAGGGGAVFYLKKKAAAAAAAAEAEDGDAAPAHAAKGTPHDPAHVPTFLPLEPFVVNLADKDADRYAQIGITLEIDDPKFADQLKAYMPAIRNGILMVLAHKTSAELLERAGKVALAGEIMREAVRTARHRARRPGRRSTTPRATRKPRRGQPEAQAQAEEEGRGRAEPAAPRPLSRTSSGWRRANEPADPLAGRSRRAAPGDHRREPEDRGGGGAAGRRAQLRPVEPGAHRSRAHAHDGDHQRALRSQHPHRPVQLHPQEPGDRRSAASRCRSTAPSCARSSCRRTSTSSACGRCAARG